MEKKLDRILLLILTFFPAVGAGCADSGGLAVAGKVGTLGLGGELTTAVTSDINTRVGYNRMDFDFDGDLADIDYDFELDFHSFSALVDWFVFDGPIRVTGGIISMDHKLHLEASGASGELEGIGDGTYDWADIGILSGTAEVDGVAPYFGIGFGKNILDKDQRWGFYGDAGIAFTSSPGVTLASTGSVPGLADDLAKESKNIEDDLEFFRYYPVFSVGLFIRF